MTKRTLDITEIQKLHRAGQLTEARDAYLAILRINPRHADVLHALGIICAQQEEFPEAIEYFQKALQFQARDPSIALHLANVLKIQGLFNQAAELLESTIKKHPDYVPAYNNLGTIYYAQAKFDDAIAAYRHAIAKHPNYIDAYYNLALALTKKNRLEEASHIYKRILETVPEHSAARFHFACLLMQQDQIEPALKEFLLIEAVQPFHFETQTNLATCYLKQGKLNEAKTHYLKALELKPEDTQILFNLGVIGMQQGNIDNAIQHYQRATIINPDYFAAHNNLGVAFLTKQHIDLAQHHFEQALRIQPNNSAIAYTVQMLAQKQRLLAAPPDYVQSLFDAYADHYESHLLKALEYQVPQQLFTLAKNSLSKSHLLDILDLGCGTGLCGIPFKPYARSLIGIDLSQKMLDVAMQKNIYSELLKSDLNSYLTHQSNQFDLILAGDVLVYIGDLEEIFTYAKNALRKNGLFIFNSEITDQEDYKMNQSGRFSHSKTYLDALAIKNQFELLKYQVCTTRMQNNEPVYGHLYMLQRRE